MLDIKSIANANLDIDVDTDDVKCSGKGVQPSDSSLVTLACQANTNGNRAIDSNSGGDGCLLEIPDRIQSISVHCDQCRGCSNA